MIGMLALAGLCSACTSGRNAPLTAGTFVGTYVYYSGDNSEAHDPDKLTLRADGTYFLVHMPGGHPGSAEEGTWELLNDPAPKQGIWRFLSATEHRIAFGDRIYPVEITGKHIRLLIDVDLEQWYEKTG